MNRLRSAQFLGVAPRFSGAIAAREAIQYALLDALFPPRCTGCRRFCREVFCYACRPFLRPLESPFCAICSAPFQKGVFNAEICASCRGTQPAFIAARSPFLYGGPIRHAIHRFKYDQKFSYARRLAPLLWMKWQNDPTLNSQNFAAIVPVPLHTQRQKTRGFNQSALLAQELSVLSQIETQNALLRVRKTPPQVGLNAQERQKNVAKAFEIAGDVGGKTLLLVDDVFTTGATLGECAKILKKAGAQDIFALTLARQQAPNMPDPPLKVIEWVVF